MTNGPVDIFIHGCCQTCCEHSVNLKQNVQQGEK